MEITMSVEGYNSLQAFAKHFAARPGRAGDSVWEYIHLVISDGRARAVALDNYKLGEMVVSLLGDNSEDLSGSMLIPLTGKLKKADGVVRIADKELGIEIQTASGSSSCPTPPAKDYPDVDKLYPQGEAKEVFRVDPAVLAEALKAFAGEDSVSVEYRSPRAGLVIQGVTKKALVMLRRA